MCLGDTTSLSLVPIPIPGSSWQLTSSTQPLAAWLLPWSPGLDAASLPLGSGTGHTVSGGGHQLPRQDRGCTHRLEIAVNDLLYIEHLQTLQYRQGEAPND